jgi:hypothetical protein
MTCLEPISRLSAVSPATSLRKKPYTDYAAEAGLLALRERRMRVTKVVSDCRLGTEQADIQDFTSAREKVLYRKDENTPAGLYL